MPRPSKFDNEKGRSICERLRAGNTRKASVESIGVAYTTFLRWIGNPDNASFATDVTRAEAEAEAMMVVTIQKAARGFESGSKTETTKTVVKMRKTTYPDGRVVEEPVPIQETTKSVVTANEFDWRAAETWLKRRRRDEWGDNLSLSRLSDEDVIALATGGVPGVNQAGDTAG